jgi:hypothetical protein
MERHRAPGINRRSRLRHRFRESAGGGPGADHHPDHGDEVNKALLEIVDQRDKKLAGS